MSRKLFTVLLCLLLCASMLPTAAMATVDGDEHTHSLTYVPTSQGCEGGYGEHYVCDCGAWFLDAEGLYEIDRSSITLPEKHVKPEEQSKIKVTPATCTAAGSVAYTCTACGRKVTDPIKKLDHSMVYIQGSAKTCSMPGAVAHFDCQTCGRHFADAEGKVEITDVTIPASHNLQPVSAVNATCLKSGNIAYYYCNDCGNYFTDATAAQEITQAETTTNALGHAIVHVAAKNATCAEDGNVEYWYCSREGCGAVFTNEAGTALTTADAVVISKETVSHTLTHVAAQAATCTAAGHAEYWQCSVCGKLFADAEGAEETTAAAVAINALPHSLTKTEAAAADCEHNGNIEYWTCSVCGKLFSDAAGTREIQRSDTVVPKSHSLTKTEAKDATCTEAGNIEYWTCGRKDCGKLFSDAEGTHEITLSDTVDEALGHDFVGGVCSRCQEKDEDFEPTVKSAPSSIVEGESYTIVIDADFDTATEGLKVVIDGKVIDPRYISLKKGSVEVTIDGSAFQDMKPGTYDVTVKTAQGDVKTTLTIKQVYKVNTPTVDGGKISVDKTTPAAKEIVTITAAADDGYLLKEGSLAVTDANKNSVTVTDNKFEMPEADVTVTATFVKDTEPKYTVKVTGGNPNPAEAKEGETISVTADTPAKKRFEKWTSSPAVKFSDAAASTATFTMPGENVTVTAVFKDLYNVTVSPTPANGTVTADKASAVEGETVKLTVKADNNYARKTLTVKNNTTGKAVTLKDDSFTMPASDVTVTATFERIKIVKGNGGTAHYGSRYSFALNTDFDDMVVWVDGRTVSGYGVDGANGTITLGRSLIKSLAVGYHEIGFVTDRGSTIGTFYVSSSPKTGDESNVALYVTAGVISAAGIGFIAWYLLKKRK